MDQINKWILRFKEAQNTWAIVFVYLMAGLGFIFGLLNMMMWFIEKTGEIPEFLFWILTGFDAMIYAGLMIMGIKMILICVRWIKRRK